MFHPWVPCVIQERVLTCSALCSESRVRLGAGEHVPFRTEVFIPGEPVPLAANLLPAAGG